MKTRNVFILTILSLIIISLFACVYATNAATQTVDDVGNALKDTGNAIGNGISNTVSDIGQGVSNTASDIGQGARNATQDMSNDMNNSGNNTTSSNNVNDTTSNTNANNTRMNNSDYTTNTVAYTNTPNDTVNVFGVNVSRTGFIFFVIALASIAVAVLVFSYVSQENDNYRDNS